MDCLSDTCPAITNIYRPYPTRHGIQILFAIDIPNPHPFQPIDRLEVRMVRGGATYNIDNVVVTPANGLRATELSPISNIERTPDGTTLTIPIALGRRIGAEYSPDLSDGSWIDLGNFFNIGDARATFIDPDPLRRQRPSGYYRAFLRPLVEPP